MRHIPQKTELRQTAAQLAETVPIAEEIVKKFLEERVLASLRGDCPHAPHNAAVKNPHTDAEFWREWNVRTNDFAELTKLLLKHIFGERFLVPLEDSDRVIQLVDGNLFFYLLPLFLP